MPAFEAPSFSLGLDLDPPDPAGEGEPSSPHPAPCPSSTAPLLQLPDDDHFEPHTMDEEFSENQAPVLMRLRRGPKTTTESAKGPLFMDFPPNLDDDIEDFSSQEDRSTDDIISTQYHSLCSSSKIPLNGTGVLTANHFKDMKVSKEPKSSASAISEIDNDRKIFPKLTVSPLRRFQLLDSDSDDSPIKEVVTKVPTDTHKLTKGAQFVSIHDETASDRKTKKASVSLGQAKDFWKDFCPIKKLSVATPTLDEVFDEYFSGMKNKDAAHKPQTASVNKKMIHPQTSSSSKDIERNSDTSASLPPAHQYFLHEDLRIQKLVRSRLPHFFPLGISENQGNRQLDAASIDYMEQFNHGEGSKRKAASHAETSRLQRTGELTNCKDLTKDRKKPRKSRGVEVSETSGSWVNPKTSASNPKNAGKRRVHAESCSSGHWFTASGGRRVYVTKSGQELTGKSAYSHYKKESGGGYKRSRKKGSAKTR